jgi:hypothetical protein
LEVVPTWSPCIAGASIDGRHNPAIWHAIDELRAAARLAGENARRRLGVARSPHSPGDAET